MFRTVLFSGDNPTGRYKARVAADGGILNQYNNTQAIVKMLQSQGMYKNTLLLWTGEGGVKLRTDALPDMFVTKAYSIQLPANDLAQTTASSQPWLSGNIAPNERPCLLNPNGGSRFLTHPAISFANGDAWSCTIVFNWNGRTSVGGQRLLGDVTNLSALFFEIGSNEMYFRNASDVRVSLGTNLFAGKNTVLQLIAPGNGKLKKLINGVEIEYTVATDFVFAAILKSYLASVGYCKLYYYRIQSGAISAGQALAEYNTLRAIVPERESVIIGSQAWTTSNLDIVCDAAGVVIPEVTDNAAWAALTTPAWCHYNNDSANGAIYGKLYNWYAVKQIDDALAATGSEWRVPTQAQFNTLATTLGGASVAGGKMKVAGTSYWTTPNTGADNSSGFTSLAGGRRVEGTGAFSQMGNLYQVCLADQYNATDLKLYSLSYNDTVTTLANSTKTRGLSVRLVKNL